MSTWAPGHRACLRRGVLVGLELMAQALAAVGRPDLRGAKFSPLRLQLMPATNFRVGAGGPEHAPSRLARRARRQADAKRRSGLAWRIARPVAASGTAPAAASASPFRCFLWAESR